MGRWRKNGLDSAHFAFEETQGLGQNKIFDQQTLLLPKDQFSRTEDN
jgi:hypothetical protein